jgi:arginase family enzyme
LCRSPKLVALEFVEVNPTLDEKKNRMAEVALELITNCTRTLIESWK